MVQGLGIASFDRLLKFLNCDADIYIGKVTFNIKFVSMMESYTGACFKTKSSANSTVAIVILSSSSVSGKSFTLMKSLELSII